MLELFEQNPCLIALLIIVAVVIYAKLQSQESFTPYDYFQNPELEQSNHIKWKYVYDATKNDPTPIKSPINYQMDWRP